MWLLVVSYYLFSCVCVPPLIQDDDDMGVAPAGGGRPTYSAPADLLNNVPSNEQVNSIFFFWFPPPVACTEPRWCCTPLP